MSMYKRHPWWADLAWLLVFLGFAALMALALVLPWVLQISPGGRALERYSPRADGDASLMLLTGPDGTLQGVQSTSYRLFASGEAMIGGLRQAQREALGTFLLGGEGLTFSGSDLDALGSARIFGAQSVTQKTDGSLQKNQAVYVRTRQGDFLLGIYTPADNLEQAFSPPILILPKGVSDGDTWSSAGSLGPMQYRGSAAARREGAYTGRAGRLEDCLEVSLDLELQVDKQEPFRQKMTDIYCAGVGVVESRVQDASGALVQRLELVSSTHLAAAPGTDALLQAAQAWTAGSPGSLDDWRLERLGRLRDLQENAEPTFLPVFVPSDPPLLLASGFGGDLIAYDAAQPNGKTAWRYPAGGEVFGRPGFDLQNGLLFFGASNGRLTTLDLRGGFRWSFQTGDNVASQPLAAGGRVVFGSEDRGVYCLDARSGALLWEAQTGGAVVSSPGLWQNVVIIGSDDGGVYAYDLESGALRWTFATEDAVEAPVTVDGGIAYVASRDQVLYALDALTGREQWQGRVGRPLRSAPLLTEGRAYVIDTEGYLTALDRATGERLWTSLEHAYYGQPVQVGGGLLVAGDVQTVFLLNLDGKTERFWKPEMPGEGDFSLGLAQGGGAVWSTDHKGGVYRLGTPLEGALSLPITWKYSLAEAPFRQNPFFSSPVMWKRQALVVDEGGGVYRVDPQGGAAQSLGNISMEYALRVGPVVVDDLLLALAGSQLAAFRLPGLQEVWRTAGRGLSTQAPLVVDGKVFWLEMSDPRSGRVQTFLRAHNLANGKVLWEQAFEGNINVPGGMVVNNGIVYISTPPAALRAADGKLLWRDGKGMGIGAPALSPDGAVLYAALLEGDAGSVAAYGASDGARLWQADLQGDSLGLYDGLWLDGSILLAPQARGKGGVAALDIREGNLLWRYIPESPRFGRPLVENGTAWLVMENGQVEALDVHNGTPRARMGDTQQPLQAYQAAQQPLRTGDRLLLSTGWYVMGVQIP